MKKIVLLVVAAVLAVGCAHMQQQQSISKAEIEQVALTLTDIGKQMQSYHKTYNKWPEKPGDFAALNMGNPSTTKWQYSFFCPKSDSWLACKVVAHQPSNDFVEIILNLGTGKDSNDPIYMYRFDTHLHVKAMDQFQSND